MNSEEFVTRIRVAVYESVVQGTLSLLRRPPGRKPSVALVELSRWFKELAPEDQDRVQAIIRLAVRSSVFGMLAVLDGVRSIREAGEPVRTLELWSAADEESVLLNGPNDEFLHDIFAAQVPPE